MPYRPRRKNPFLSNSTFKDVLDRVFELCKLFEASDVHCFFMFVVKAAPDNVTSCGTKLLKKFLIDNPDIAKAFGRFCIQFNTATVVQKDSCNGEITSETADVNSSTSESQVEIKDEHNNIGDIEDERNGHAAQTCEKLTGNKQLQNGDNVECLLHNASLRCKLFEKNGMHGFVMFAKKSSPAEVICCGTSHGAKFLVDNPDIGKEFRTYCTQFKNAHKDLTDTRNSEPNSDTTDVHESFSESHVKINRVQSVCFSECTRNKAKTDGTGAGDLHHSEQESDRRLSIPSSCLVTKHMAESLPENSETNESILEPHIDEETVEATHVKCCICSKIFNNRNNMKQHCLRMHTKKKYLCKFCDKTFSFMYELLRHEEYHRLKKSLYKTGKSKMPRERAKTGKSKMSRERAKKEQLNWTLTFKVPIGGRKVQEAILKCTICMKTFTTKDLLNSHVNRVHNKTTHPCKFCNKSYGYRCHLIKHEQCHFQHNKYQHRNKKCKTLRLLKRHESLHTQNDRYLCDRCGIEVNSKIKMWSHRQTHFYKRPPSRKNDFKCAYCPATFKKLYTRSLHLRDNHAEIALADGSSFINKCPICDKIIVDKFQNHIDRHNKIKRFQCAICKTHFSTRANWFGHMARIHDIEAF